jgi:dTDP-4-dehydrorhamnose reductase
LEYCESHLDLAKNLHTNVLEILSNHCDKLIYISTNPNKFDNVYYLTKYEGEMRTLLLDNNNLVIRTNIYGDGGLVNWAVTNLQNNKSINGYTNSIFNAIHVQQLSETIYNSLLNKTGIVNVAGNYRISKFDFIYLVALQLNLPTNLIMPTCLEYDQDLTINESVYDFSLAEGLGFLKKSYYI